MREAHFTAPEQDAEPESDAMDVAEETVSPSISADVSVSHQPTRKQPSAASKTKVRDDTEQASVPATHSDEPTEFSQTIVSSSAPASADIRIRKKQRVLTDSTSSAPAAAAYSLESVFSVEGLLRDNDWSPQISQNTSLVHLLNDFSLEGHQTVALKLSVTPNVGRWSVNVCPEDPLDMVDVYMHFNPRYKSNEVVLNDVQGTWGG